HQFSSETHDSFPRLRQAYILKLRLMGTTAFTTLPSAVKGANFHFLTASTAGFVNTGLPLTIFTFSTVPFSATTASSSTGPSILSCLAIAGYSGCTFVVAAFSPSTRLTFFGSWAAQATARTMPSHMTPLHPRTRLRSQIVMVDISAGAPKILSRFVHIY